MTANGWPIRWAIQIVVEDEAVHPDVIAEICISWHKNYNIYHWHIQIVLILQLLSLNFRFKTYIHIFIDDKLLNF